VQQKSAATASPCTDLSGPDTTDVHLPPHLRGIIALLPIFCCMPRRRDWPDLG
jgi:hypothetical protein